VTDRSKSISFLHLAFLSAGIGSRRFCSPKIDAEFTNEKQMRKMKTIEHLWYESFSENGNNITKHLFLEIKQELYSKKNTYLQGLWMHLTVPKQMKHLFLHLTCLHLIAVWQISPSSVPSLNLKQPWISNFIIDNLNFMQIWYCNQIWMILANI